MGFGRTARGHSFMYHAGTVVDSVGGTYGSRGGGGGWHGELAVQLAYAM